MLKKGRVSFMRATKTDCMNCVVNKLQNSLYTLLGGVTDLLCRAKSQFISWAIRKAVRAEFRTAKVKHGTPCDFAVRGGHSALTPSVYGLLVLRFNESRMGFKTIKL